MTSQVKLADDSPHFDALDSQKVPQCGSVGVFAATFAKFDKMSFWPAHLVDAGAKKPWSGSANRNCFTVTARAAEVHQHIKAGTR
jgi:hypothetical protein